MSLFDELKNIGRSVEDLGNDPLVKVSNEIADEIRKQLREQDLYVNGAMVEATQALPPRITANGFEVQIQSTDYYKFVDEGVNGVENNLGSRYSFRTLKPFPKDGIRSLMQWIPLRGINTQGQTLEQTAYAISVGLKKKGIKPRNMTDKIFQDPKFINLLESRVSDLVGVAISLKFDRKIETWQSFQ